MQALAPVVPEDAVVDCLTMLCGFTKGQWYAVDEWAREMNRSSYAAWEEAYQRCLESLAAEAVDPLVGLPPAAAASRAVWRIADGAGASVLATAAVVAAVAALAARASVSQEDFAVLWAPLERARLSGFRVIPGGGGDRTWTA